VYANSNHDQLNAIQKILDQLLKNEGLKLSQIAVLVAGGITDFSGFKGIKNIGKHLLTDSINDWKSEQGVLLESSKRFKGLESDVVIIAGMPEPGSSEFFTESDLYVSASRAKHRLYLICKSSGAQKYSLEVVEKSKKEPESENNLIDVALS
jgi:superfamily I DNA/RNA helicase